MSQEPVTSQPKSLKVDVDIPDIDINYLMKGNWRVGYLECLADPPMCLLGYCCPCVLSWFIAEKLGENPLLYCLGGFCFPISVLMRYRTRQKFGIEVLIS